MKQFVKSHIPILSLSLFLISVVTLWALTTDKCLEIRITSKQIEIKVACDQKVKNKSNSLIVALVQIL